MSKILYYTRAGFGGNEPLPFETIDRIYMRCHDCEKEMIYWDKENNCYLNDILTCPHCGSKFLAPPLK